MRIGVLWSLVYLMLTSIGLQSYTLVAIYAALLALCQVGLQQVGIVAHFVVALSDPLEGGVADGTQLLAAASFVTLHPRACEPVIKVLVEQGRIALKSESVRITALQLSSCWNSYLPHAQISDGLTLSHLCHYMINRRVM